MTITLPQELFALVTFVQILINMLFNYKKLTGILLLIITSTAWGQKLKKSDRVLLERLQSHINFLADDKLEGRRIGTGGEQLAYEYINDEFAKIGLKDETGDQYFIQEFPVYDGKKINDETHLIINDKDVKLDKEYFPLSFSANNTAESSSAIALQESGSVWLADIKDQLKENKNNPHFDLPDAVKTMANNAARKGATALIIFNSGKQDDELKFEPKSKTETVKIPVLYLTKEGQKNYLKKTQHINTS